MARRESDHSLRIRWSPPPSIDATRLLRERLPTDAQFRSVVSVYGNAACLTATFEDHNTKNVALDLAKEMFKEPEAVVDTSFDGITVWNTVENPNLDICAVHGLGGIAADSFAANNKLWLRDFLPNQPPFQNARISTFGYTSGLFDQSSTDRLSDWADYLLEAICNLRNSTETTKIPIIFIGHSMGGLIVRSAIEHLFQFARDTKYGGVKMSQCAVLFLATPHDGSATLEFNDFLSEILRSAFGMRKDLVVDELRSLNSSATRSKRVWDQMNQQNQMPPIECLTESQKTKLSKWLSKPALLVEQSAAGLGGKFANKIPDADHRTVCKFADPVSPAFIMVVTRLRALKQALVTRSHSTSSRDLFQVETPISPAAPPRGTKRKLADLELTVQPSNQHWIVARPLNSFFTGRMEDLKVIEEAILSSYKTSDDVSVPKRYVVTGMGGQGKSELCLRVAHKLRSKFWGVFWVDVSSRSTTESGYIHVAKMIGRHVENIEEALHVLSNLHNSWMLILDNADDLYYDYQQSFPSGDSGLIVITSRNGNCSQYATIGSRDLSGLTRDDARQLLLKMIKVPPAQAKAMQKQAEQVASLLGYHPLALLQAGAYVARRHCTLEDYPKVFEQQRQRLLHFLPRQAQSRYGNVYATLEASARMLEQSDDDQAAKDALDLLSMLSLVNCSEFSLSVFEHAWEEAHAVLRNHRENKGLEQLSPWHVDQMIPLARPDKEAWDSFRLLEACHLLQSLSLIFFESGSVTTGAISLHPLTHAWARERQSQVNQERVWMMGATTIALALGQDDRWVRLERQMKPHLQVLVAKAPADIYRCGSSLEVTRTLYQLLRILGWMSDDYRVNSVLERMFNQLRLDADLVSATCLPLYDLLGENLRKTRQLPRSIAVLEQVLSLRQHQARHDPARLNAQQELAKAYRASGRSEESIQMLEEVVRIREANPVDDRSMLEAQYELALAYSWQDRSRDDVDTLKRAFHMRRSSAPEPSDTLISPIVPAALQSKSSKSMEALALLEHVYKALQRTRPEDDPAKLTVQHNLSKLYAHHGRMNDAIEMLEEAIEQSSYKSDDNRDRLGIMGELGRQYYMAGRNKDAIEVVERVVQIREADVSHDHRNRWRAQGLLALAYEADGQTEKAFDLMQRVLAIREEHGEVKDPAELQQFESLLHMWTQKYDE